MGILPNNPSESPYTMSETWDPYRLSSWGGRWGLLLVEMCPMGFQYHRYAFFLHSVTFILKFHSKDWGGLFFKSNFKRFNLT